MNELEPTEPDSDEQRPEDFVAPRNDGTESPSEPVDEPAPETTIEEGEDLLAEFVESEEMRDLRQQAYDAINALWRANQLEGKKIDPDMPISLDPFNEQFYQPFMALGEAQIAKIAPERQEQARIELDVISSRFRQDCGFQNNALARLGMLDTQYKKAGRTDLAELLLRRWTESKATWTKFKREELTVAPETIKRFLQGVTIETFNQGENTGQSINCQLHEEVSLPDFRLLVQKAIIPWLTDTGTVWVRGDNLPPDYLQALADEMLRTDFPAIAVYDKESGQYVSVYDEGGEDDHEEEPTVANLVEACRELLDEESITALQEIADYDEASGLAFTLLIEAGVDDPEEFLRDKGLIE